MADRLDDCLRQKVTEAELNLAFELRNALPGVEAGTALGTGDRPGGGATAELVDMSLKRPKTCNARWVLADREG